jgi:outer membrane protein assembly factor BamD
MPLRPLLYISLFSTLALLCACKSAPVPVQNAEANFKDAQTSYASGKYTDAITKWKKVKEAYSSPELTTQAELKIADAYFENKDYVEAAAAYEEFRKLHPRNEKSAYALFKLGLSHYQQITGIDTDQTPVKSARLALQTFLTQYPDSVYAEQVKLKLAVCQLKQLQYENYVGNFYLRTGKYPSAIKRLNEALLRFPDSPALDQTLFYLGKAYKKSGAKVQARETFSKLLQKYPKSPLAADSAKMLEGV